MCEQVHDDPDLLAETEYTAAVVAAQERLAERRRDLTTAIHEAKALGVEVALSRQVDAAWHAVLRAEAYLRWVSGGMVETQ